MNPFDSASMGEGYAKSRPAVHPHILNEATRALGRTEPWRRALVVGCGAGLSTQALGTAEAIPIDRGAIDVITAAGSPNFVAKYI